MQYLIPQNTFLRVSNVDADEIRTHLTPVPQRAEPVRGQTSALETLSRDLGKQDTPAARRASIDKRKALFERVPKLQPTFGGFEVKAVQERNADE